MNNIKPLKRFGQNYLKDTNILKKIVDEINPLKGENILEIGPGYGALTDELIKRIDRLIAVEIDGRIVNRLEMEFPEVKFIKGDFLKLQLNHFADESNKLRIVGNIPYNLTSPILFKLIENNKLIKDAVLMVQYEVAKRMNAKKGTKDYGILAALLKYFTDTKLCFKVSPNVFYPKPKVYSTVVHINFKKLNSIKAEQKMFIKIVKASFGNRRKTLKNSLSNSIFNKIDFSDSGINLSLRAEQLDIKDFLILSEFASTWLNQTSQTV